MTQLISITIKVKEEKKKKNVPEAAFNGDQDLKKLKKMPCQSLTHETALFNDKRHN